MAYRFQSTQPLPNEIRRIAREEIDSAIDQLAHGKNREGAVHEARKSLKKLRSLLRLVRGELGEVYQTENNRFRNTGRNLSKLRDAAATLEMFDQLVTDYHHSIPKADLAAIRRGLEAGKKETEKKIGLERTTRNAVTALRTARKRIDSWPLQKPDFEAIAPGLKKRYRGGLQAMKTASADTTAPNLHEWRKRVKDQRYHMHLLVGLTPDDLEVREKDLHDLETWLGDHQNLAVLSAEIETHPGRYGGEVPVAEFLHLAKQASDSLRDKAFSLGAKLYREKPKKFIAQMEKLWKDWQQTPARKPVALTSPPKARKAVA